MCCGSVQLLLLELEKASSVLYQLQLIVLNVFFEGGVCVCV